MSKKIQSMQGLLGKEEAGYILPHEHVQWNQIPYANPESNDPEERRKRTEKVGVWNRSDVEMRPFSYLDDLVLLTEEEIIDDIVDLKKNGGTTIVEQSMPNFSRDLDTMNVLYKKTGIQFVYSTGNYIEPFWSDKERQRTLEEMKNEILSEFRDGVGDKKWKPGLIGEIGITSMNNEMEIKSLRAAAQAQKEIGCSLSIHPELFTEKGEIAQKGLDILDIVEEEGGNIEKTILCHCDLNVADPDYVEALLKRGCYAEFDQMGMYAMSMKILPGKYLPSDLHRVDTIKTLVDRGYADHILISHDICYKHLLKKWGGHGYSHILENIIPMMIEYGKIDSDIVHQIAYDNPFKSLAW